MTRLAKPAISILCLLLWVSLESMSSVARAQWTQQSCASRHRIPVTVTAVGGTHSTETRIDLTSSDFPAEYVFSTGGEDVRVLESDDTTAVNFVVTGWDSGARTATIYVRLPPIASGNSELIYIYFGDETLASADDIDGVFPAVGLRMRSRVSTADPTSAATGLAAFAAATVDVYDQVRANFSGLNNRALGGTNGNFGWCVSGLIEVTPATAGLWNFRYGADFGRGGHLYVSEQALEEDWNDDLWWAGNYANTGETLSGSINLTEGWHRYEALGFEGCCDGAAGFQAQPPGSPWLDLNTSNFTMRGAQCVNTTSSTAISASESCPTDLLISKTVEVDATSSFNFAVPGSVMRYEILVQNPGQKVDSTTLVLSDEIPDEIALVVTGTGAFEFTDGATSSGLTYSYAGPSSTTDSVEFSTDGTNFGYTPSSPTDSSVTHIRIRPTGELNPSAGTSTPSFTISVLGVVE